MNTISRHAVLDRQGNAVDGASQQAVAFYDQALEELNLYRNDPVATIDQAIETEPGFVMAHALKAWLMALSTEPAAMQEAQSILIKAQGLPADDRAASHLNALSAVLQGNWSQAATMLDFHNMRYPRDLLALQAGHLLDFYRANARDLRDRIARVLPQWTPDDAGYPIVLGMQAFGLEESGDYSRAEDFGLRAIEAQPLDAWAHHAIAHVMEMQDRIEDADNWMQTRQAYWSGEENFFRVHNWWHWAVTHLNANRIEAAMALYDGPIRQDKSAVALDLVDAAALLWRVQLLGGEPGNRWVELAAAWQEHADGKRYAFNDWHAAMAYLGAGRLTDCEQLLQTCEAQSAQGTEAGQWAASTGSQLISGFIAFAKGNYERCVEILHAARAITNGFGGSHAQRDCIDCTLVEAAIRANMADVAKALAEERLALRPDNSMNLGFRERALALAG